MVEQQHLIVYTKLEVLLKKLLVCSLLCALFGFASLASAQQGDATIGFGTIMSPSAKSCGATGSLNFVCPETGGLYPKIGADVIFAKRLGVGFDAAWRGGQGTYPSGQPYRPILIDINGVFQPRLSKKAGLDLVGGIGWQDTRFYGYTNSSGCIYFGQCYTSSNHFMVDAGAGIRYYVWGHVFVRPEFRLYHIVNNTTDFTSNNVIHVGASIGYTIGPE